MNLLTQTREEIAESETAYVYYFEETTATWYRCPLSAWEADEIIWLECYPPLEIQDAHRSHC